MESKLTNRIAERLIETRLPIIGLFEGFGSLLVTPRFIDFSLVKNTTVWPIINLLFSSTEFIALSKYYSYYSIQGITLTCENNFDKSVWIEGSNNWQFMIVPDIRFSIGPYIVGSSPDPNLPTAEVNYSRDNAMSVRIDAHQPTTKYFEMPSCVQYSGYTYEDELELPRPAVFVMGKDVWNDFNYMKHIDIIPPDNGFYLIGPSIFMGNVEDFVLNKPSFVSRVPILTTLRVVIHILVKDRINHDVWN